MERPFNYPKGVITVLRNLIKVGWRGISRWTDSSKVSYVWGCSDLREEETSTKWGRGNFVNLQGCPKLTIFFKRNWLIVVCFSLIKTSKSHNFFLKTYFKTENFTWYASFLMVELRKFYSSYNFPPWFSPFSFQAYFICSIFVWIPYRNGWQLDMCL